MTRTDTRLEAKEKRLKAQFAAMETAMSASQTQLAWLQGQLASSADLELTSGSTGAPSRPITGGDRPSPCGAAMTAYATPSPAAY